MVKTLKMEYTILLWLFGLYSTREVQATTHWMVTETGLIQPRAESPYEMARPYDLLAFLNQDTRYENLKKLFVDLSNRQVDIDKQWRELIKDTDINTHLSKDKNCVKALPLSELNWYAAYLEEGLSKHISEDEYQLWTPRFGDDSLVPDCKKQLSLTYSLGVFEHLEAMINRGNLSIHAELSLPELIAPLMTAEQFGHWVATILAKNTTSWLHYNMASLFWRTRGNAPKAIECSRRAVNFAPREYKDIALLSLGTIFLRAKKAADAVIVLKAAVDHDSNNFYANFILANAYALAGDFNNSLKYFDKTLKMNSAFEHAVKNKFGILCERELIKTVLKINKKIQQLRQELVNYQVKESEKIMIQGDFLSTMKLHQEIDFQNIEQITEKMSQIMGLNFKKLKRQGDKNSLIKYYFDGPLYNDQWISERGVMIVDAAYSLQRLVRHIMKQIERSAKIKFTPELLKMPGYNVKSEVGPLPATPDIGIRNPLLLLVKSKAEAESQSSSQPLERSSGQRPAPPPDEPTEVDETHEFDLHLPRYPPTMKINRNVEEFDRSADWPPEALCKSLRVLPNTNNVVIYPTFLPFENKGLSLKGILTEKIGVSIHEEHELPWHPPACPTTKETHAALKKAQKPQVALTVAPTDYLRLKLLEYVGDGYSSLVQHMQEAEVGQRIYTAMQANVAPKWILYTIASLYWRVRNNNQNALSCLISANKIVKPRWKDVVLTSMASVYLEMGVIDESLQAADEAFKLSLYEPPTNFVLAQLNLVNKHRNTQLFHLKQVIRVEPSYMGRLARTLLTGFACLYKQQYSGNKIELADGEVCREIEPGINVICDKTQTHCQRTNLQCFTNTERESTSTLVRLMQIKNEPVQPEDINENVFEPFITNIPLEISDKEGHSYTFNLMVDILNSLKGCGSKGCSSITIEDLALKEDECSYQYLQLAYWLQIISFRQLVTEYEGKLLLEITSITATGKKIPECHVQGDPSLHFYLDRMMQVSAEGWEPQTSLMHQVAETFDFSDYGALGAKFARYVEMKPRGWAGALAAAWWCGAAGRGACAVRCSAAAFSLAPAAHGPLALRSLAALLHAHTKHEEAKQIAYLAFYMSPKSHVDAFLVAVSNTYLEEYEQAVWMYRYALTFDESFLPAKSCLHATMCIMLYADTAKLTGRHGLI